MTDKETSQPEIQLSHMATFAAITLTALITLPYILPIVKKMIGEKEPSPDELAKQRLAGIELCLNRKEHKYGSFDSFLQEQGNSLYVKLDTHSNLEPYKTFHYGFDMARNTVKKTWFETDSFILVTKKEHNEGIVPIAKASPFEQEVASVIRGCIDHAEKQPKKQLKTLHN